MTNTITKRLIGRQDIKPWDGVNETFSYTTEDNVDLTLHRCGNAVDVLAAYGYHSSRSSTAINAAISAIGSNAVTLELDPGAWSASADVTIPATAATVLYGALTAASGKTVTFNGPLYCRGSLVATGTIVVNGHFDAPDKQVFSGAGTITWGNGQPFRAAWVGVVADGVTECKTQLAAAAAIARTAGVDLILPSGTILCTPTTAISLAGIPEVRTDGGNCTLDCSSVTIGPVFTCYGTRTTIASAQTIASGDVALTVDAGTYPQGTQILIASDESIPNTNREGDATPTYYCKGGRHYVQNYSAPTLTVGPPVDFAYTNAYVYKLDEAVIKIGRKITFQGNTAYNGRGLIVRYAKADISAKFKNFRNGNVIFQDSRGRYDGEISNHYVASDNGYGCCVHDLSSVAIVGAHITNCRHCVTGGGAAFWNKTDFGGADAAVALPGRYTVTGGFYENVDSYNAAATSLALECHGNMKSMVVTGATIRGGLGLNAHHTVISGNVITYRKRYGVHFGTDCNSTSWGELTLTSNAISCDGTAISGASFHAFVLDSGNKVKKIHISANNVIKTTNTNDATFANIAGECLDIRITNNEFMGHPGTGAALDLTFTIAQYGYLNFSNNKLTYLGLKVTPKTAGITGDIGGNTVYLAGVNGIYMVSDATGYYLILNMLSNNCYKNQRHGIFVQSKVIALDVSGSRCRNNNQSGGSYDGLDLDLDDACTSFVARNLNCEDTQAAPTQRYGLNATGGASCVANLFANGVNGIGCTAGNVISGAGLVWQERYGIRAGAGTAYPDDLLMSSTVGGVSGLVITGGTVNLGVAGFAAAIGSLYANTSTGVLYVKTGSGDTAWTVVGTQT